MQSFGLVGSIRPANPGSSSDCANLAAACHGIAN